MQLQKRQPTFEILQVFTKVTFFTGLYQRRYQDHRQRLAGATMMMEEAFVLTVRDGSTVPIYCCNDELSSTIS